MIILTIPLITVSPTRIVTLPNAYLLYLKIPGLYVLLTDNSLCWGTYQKTIDLHDFILIKLYRDFNLVSYAKQLLFQSIIYFEFQKN